MKNKFYWGLAILIILIITGTTVFVKEQAEIRELKEQLAEAEKLANQIEERKAAENNPPPAELGFKWVRHGDHWDKVPVTQSEVPHQTPASEEIALESSVLKSDLPDKLPANFPTDAELQKMNNMDILHLITLYKKEIKTLRKTDYDASVRLSHAVIPKLGERLLELVEEGNALTEKMNRRSMNSPRFYPATEGVPARITTVVPPDDYESEKSEGGNK